MDDIRPNPHLEWEYKPADEPQPAQKDDSTKEVVAGIFIFFFSVILSFVGVFLPTLFIVGEFLDPTPATLRAIKVAGFLALVIVVIAGVLFSKKKYVIASGILLGAILAVGLYALGYYYYSNDQTLPLFESILSFFSL